MSLILSQRIVLLAALVAVLPFARSAPSVTQAPATQAPRGDAVYGYLDNPRMLGEGQQSPHVRLLPYASERSAMKGGEITPWTQTLDGAWRVKVLPHPREVPADFHSLAYDVSTWREVRVPHTLQTDGLDHPMFRNTAVEAWPDDPPHTPRDVNPTAAYIREFELPAGWTDRRTYLRFEGATSAYFVWVNGHYVGYDQGGYTPAEFEIGGRLRPGHNRIAVQLHRWSAGTYLEDYDQWRYSGIFRSVWLYSTPRQHIRDLWVETDLDADYRDATLKADAFLELDGSPARELQLRATLLDPRGRRVASQTVAIDGARVDLRMPVSNPDKWTDETPSLYVLSLALLDGKGRLVHATRQTVGFREIEVRDRQLQVNGRRVLLKGTNRAETDPDHGRHAPRDRQWRDVRLMKRLHINAVRTSHYPSDPYFYELADRHGLWLADEMEVETHSHEHCPKCLADLPEWRDAFLERFQAMVARDRNHPSVLLWDTGNEAGLGKAHFDMAEWARTHEASRPLYHQSNFPNGDAPFAAVAGPRYPALDKLQAIARESGKPVILGEYAHAMGNSLGNFRELWEVIRAHPHMQGGFVWDWAEQNVRQPLRLVADSGMHNVPAHLIGAPELVEGHSGNALQFSGLDDFVEVYREPALEDIDKGLTLDARVRPARPFTNFTIISKGQSQYSLFLRDERTLRFSLRLSGKTVHLDAPATRLWDGDWHRVTATWDGAAMRLFVDGRQLSTKPARGRVDRNHWEVNIGRDPEHMQDVYSGRMAHGAIDQVRIHGRALGAAELAVDADPSAQALLALDFESLADHGTHLSYGESLSGVDGLVGADRELQPETAQLAWTHQPLRFAWKDGLIEVHNEQAFAATRGLDLRWTLHEGRRILASGRDPLRVEPGARFSLPIQLPPNPANIERWLTVEAVATQSRPWLARGDVHAMDQFHVGGTRIPGADLPTPHGSRPVVNESPSAIEVQGDGFLYRFDKAAGVLAAMRVREVELLHGGIRLDAWRAPNSNETYSWGNEEGKAWRAVGLDRLDSRAHSMTAQRKQDGTVIVTALNRVAAKGMDEAWFDQSITYTIDAAGTLRVRQEVSPQGRIGALPYLPRIGLALAVTDRFQHFAWYGRDLESYSDRKDGTRMGVWSSTVDQQYIDYHRPQDHGNHTDTRWALLTDRVHGGLMVIGASDVAVTPYDALDRAAYPYQRRRNDGWITFHADLAATGVGDTPNPVLKHYQVAADATHVQELLIRPLSVEEVRSGLPQEVANVR